MWTVVYMAADRETAERIKDILEEECILVKIRPGQKCSCCEGYYEVLVPESEIEEAKDCLYRAGIWSIIQGWG
ncbi:MAG: hypothetical protein WCS98_08010 [Bacillota bacterium]|jgi:DNA polymerase II small subunit/DNA polymerase delta subunit B|nr:DUF2007 domain-containing protein [Bacillota bacterium]MDD3297820.1 DUF2007 domain-containing protein [Bacillota bacterium]MDD3850813.1 DUF2007 domain-containing protein [Bacillota bacterium]MDD4707507.1 DUF2007 domain-containing protein [Bacillota bacterium]